MYRVQMKRIVKMMNKMNNSNNNNNNSMIMKMMMTKMMMDSSRLLGRGRGDKNSVICVYFYVILCFINNLKNTLIISLKKKHNKKEKISNL